MTPTPLPTQARLREIFDYDPDTGIFVWRHRADSRPTWNARHAGTVAGAVNQRGYRRICIDNHHYSAFRLAWAYVHGEEPPRLIDHVNGIKSDDRIDNLRAATASQNLQNSQGKRGRDLPKGVTQDRKTGRYRAQLKAMGVHVHLGFFGTSEEAHAAYAMGAQKYFGEFARAGRLLDPRR